VIYFRSMRPAVDGLPSVGRSARSLGVRIPTDIEPDASGCVRPHAGGMSVSPGTVWNIPHTRRPCGLGRGSTGPAADRVYSISSASLAERELEARSDSHASMLHAFVEPKAETRLETYEAALASTRPSWGQEWPL
jgi:hypothetical protein